MTDPTRMKALFLAITGAASLVIYGVLKRRTSVLVHARPGSVHCEEVSGEPCSPDFDAATGFFGKHSDYFTADVQLELYGLYKQATRGDCPAETAASSSGTRRTLMTHAWVSKTGLSSKSAQEAYVQILNTHYPQWRSGGTVQEEDNDEDPFARTEEDEADAEQYKAQFKQVSNWAAGSVPAAAIGEDGDRDESIGGLLCEMASIGNLEAISEILDKNPSIINTQDKDGMTCLHWASDRGFIQIVQYLLSKGADVNAIDHCGNSPLHIAAMSRQKEVVRLLLDAGADTTLVNCEGEAVIDLLRSEFPRVVFS